MDYLPLASVPVGSVVNHNSSLYILVQKTGQDIILANRPLGCRYIEEVVVPLLDASYITAYQYPAGVNQTVFPEWGAWYGRK